MKSLPVIVVQLVHILGPMKGEIQEYTGDSILIGRDASCHLKFPPDLAVVSRKHAQIIREGNQFRLIDSSSNGTFVNGKRVQETPLRKGDVLEFSEGGPKVSFLSEMREGQVETAPEPPPEPQPQVVETPPVQPVQEPVQEIRQPEPPVQVQQVPPRPSPEQPGQGSVRKVSMPLIIQYGPTLRSYKELPVTIGKSPRCDFSLEHPALYDQHAQVFFDQNQYWIKDLTGQQQIHVNRSPVGVQTPLHINDEIAFSPRGPVFRFLGEGRLAEVEDAPLNETPPAQDGQRAEGRDEPQEKKSGKLLSKVKKYIDKKLQ